MALRRSVRFFSPEPVPFEVIENAIATAALAPSGANQQPWRFVVVGDPETKRKIREAAAGGRIKRYYVQKSLGIAAGFLLAALQMRGLAALTHTPGFFSKILERPANERPFPLIPTGYPDPDVTVPDIHKRPLK